jgi:hypothetical protein
MTGTSIPHIPDSSHNDRHRRSDKVKTQFRRRRVLPVVLAVGTLVLASGAVLAYWTANGNGAGSGSAAAGTSNVVVVQTTALTAMYPGDSPQTISGNFNNDLNPGPVFIESVTVSIASVTKAVGAPAGTCDATDFTLTNATMIVGASIPAGNGVGAWTGATIQFNNKATNQDGCKGATVNLGYSIP